MQVNFMEELVAEWFEYCGYIVKRNERVERLSAGGYKDELDVVAFNPETNHLIHVETAVYGASWAHYEEKYKKTFGAGAKHIKFLFKGLNLPCEIEKRVIFAGGSTKNHKTVGGGKIQLVEDFVLEILKNLKGTSLLSNAVPEKYPVLRVLQIITQHKKKIVEELNSKQIHQETYD